MHPNLFSNCEHVLIFFLGLLFTLWDKAESTNRHLYHQNCYRGMIDHEISPLCYMLHNELL